MVEDEPDTSSYPLHAIPPDPEALRHAHLFVKSNHNHKNPKIHIVDPLPNRVVAFADVHGDLNATLSVLTLLKLIPSPDNPIWIAGNTHAVQTGDIVDRGPDDLAIYRLLFNLADQAEAAGGALHLLLGNHELENLCFAKSVDKYHNSDVLQKYGGQDNRDAAWQASGEVGSRLFQEHVVLRIGPFVFAHAGVLPLYADYGVKGINEKAKQDMPLWLKTRAKPSRDEADQDNGFFPLGSQGVLFSREYKKNKAGCKRLKQTLKKPAFHGVERMFIGHMPTDSQRVESHCDGHLIRMDTAMSRWMFDPPADDISRCSGVEIVKGRVFAIRNDGIREEMPLDN